MWDVFALVGVGLVVYFSFFVREKILMLYDVEGTIIARVVLFLGIVFGLFFPDSFAVVGTLLLLFILPVLVMYMRTQGGENEMERNWLGINSRCSCKCCGFRCFLLGNMEL